MVAAAIVTWVLRANATEQSIEIVHRYSDKAIQLDNTVAEGYIAKAVLIYSTIGTGN
jgi:hypothetical protein